MLFNKSYFDRELKKEPEMELDYIVVDNCPQFLC